MTGGPKDHIKIRILHSGPKAKYYKGDSRNHRLSFGPLIAALQLDPSGLGILDSNAPMV